MTTHMTQQIERPTQDEDVARTPIGRGLLRQLGPALRLVLVATVVLGIVYPAVVWGVSRIPGLAGNAEGSLLSGPVASSSEIGIDPVPADPAADPWFHLRPSASAPESATAGLGPADPSTSGGSYRASCAWLPTWPSWARSATRKRCPCCSRSPRA